MLAGACQNTPGTRMEITRTWRSAIADLKPPPPGAPSALGCARGRRPRLGLAVRCGDLTLQRKICLFRRFFTCSQNIRMAPFSLTEGFRPCLSKPSYRAPRWALMVRLMQKERLKSPQKSLIIENRAFWVILAILAKTFGHFCQPFPSQVGHPRQ